MSFLSAALMILLISVMSIDCRPSLRIKSFSQSAARLNVTEDKTDWTTISQNSSVENQTATRISVTGDKIEGNWTTITLNSSALNQTGVGMNVTEDNITETTVTTTERQTRTLPNCSSCPQSILELFYDDHCVCPTERPYTREPKRPQEKTYGSSDYDSSKKKVSLEVLAIILLVSAFFTGCIVICLRLAGCPVR